MRNRVWPGLLLFLLSTVLLAAQPLRVAVVSSSVDQSDRVAAALSRDKGLVVVERTQLDSLLTEDALDQAVAAEGTRARLGRLLGVDIFLYLRPLPASGNWQLEAIHAPTGKLLRSNTTADADSLPGAAHDILRNLDIPQMSNLPKVAVSDFQVPAFAGPPELGDTGIKLADALRIRLAENGVDVLDRLAVMHIQDEQVLSEQGFIETSHTLPPMLGADFLIGGQCSGNALRLSILAARTGKVLSERAFSSSTGAFPVISEDVMKWVLTNVAGKAATQSYVWTPSVQVEALDPFYRGIDLFHQGKKFEATAEFEKAYLMNDKFAEAYLWEARCFDAVGLQPLAEAERRFVVKTLVGRGISLSVRAIPADGITFLGVNGDDADQPLCRKLEMLLTDAVADGSHRILLPRSLATFRDEYDTLVGVRNSRGVTWDEAPGFLTGNTLSGSLRYANGRPELDLGIDDTVSGKRINTVTLGLPSDSSLWKQTIDTAIPSLFSGEEQGSASGAAAAREQLPNTAAIKALIPKEGNVAILKLAVKDPSALASDWHGLSKPVWDLTEFLNFALGEYLLTKIPQNHFARPWIELQHITLYLPYSMQGFFYSSRIRDPYAELQGFIQAHPDDLPGAIAEYILLWDTMGHIPYPELEQRFAHLSDWIARTRKGSVVQNIDYMAGMPDHLRELAIIAQDDPRRRIPLPTANFPTRIIPEFQDGSRVTLSRNFHWWHASEWEHFNVSPADAVDEARAAIAFLGRGNDGFHVNPNWIRSFPYSHALTAFAMESIRTADAGGMEPMDFPFQADKEKQAFTDIVDYVFGEIHRQIGQITSPDELSQIQCYEIRRFLTDLNHAPGMAVVPDARWQLFHDTFVKDVDAAEERMGHPQSRGYDRIWLDWRDITRQITPFLDPDNWQYCQAEIYDWKYLHDEVSAAVANSPDTPLLDSPWWRLMQRYEFKTQTRSMRAAMFKEEMPKLLREYPEDEDLAPSELGLYFTFGYTLLHGGDYPEAEALLHRVYDAPPNDLTRTGAGRQLHINAAFQLAAIAIHAGREAEAARLLREVLEARPLMAVMTDESWTAGELEPVQTYAMRLLMELREKELGMDSEGPIHQVQVRVENYFPGAVRYYYRVPPHPDPGHPIPVLYLVPPNAQDAPEYCRDDNTWARFADAHGIVLIVPSFLDMMWSRSEMPQEWSGHALLLALAEIRKQYPIDTGKLLLHGYGYGGGVVQRFAMWRPDMCLAVSVNSAINWAGEKPPKALHPFRDLTQVPFLVTCGEEEDARDRNILEGGMEFSTAIRGAGVPAIWRAWPHVGHEFSPQMEALAQAFLADAIQKSPGTRHFIGDLRNWQFFRAGDPRGKNVPPACGVDLPSLRVASLWGTEAK
jgi:hypothetical protein